MITWVSLLSDMAEAVVKTEERTYFPLELWDQGEVRRRAAAALAEGLGARLTWDEVGDKVRESIDAFLGPCEYSKEYGSTEVLIRTQHRHHGEFREMKLKF